MKLINIVSHFCKKNQDFNKREDQKECHTFVFRKLISQSNVQFLISIRRFRSENN